MYQVSDRLRLVPVPPASRFQGSGLAQQTQHDPSHESGQSVHQASSYLPRLPRSRPRPKRPMPTSTGQLTPLLLLPLPSLETKIVERRSKEA